MAGSGGTGSGVSVVTPLDVVISTEVVSRSPGHQATNHPLPVLAWTCSPSPSTSDTPVTPASTWPCTTVNGPWLVDAKWPSVICMTLPELSLRSMDQALNVPDALPSPESLALRETDTDPPLAVSWETTVIDGPVRHVAPAVPF